MRVILLVIMLSFLYGCPETMPIFGGKFYQGDSAKAGISRNNPNETPEFISASDPEIDQFTCTKTRDYKN